MRLSTTIYYFLLGYVRPHARLPTALELVLTLAAGGGCSSGEYGEKNVLFFAVFCDLERSEWAADVLWLPYRRGIDPFIFLMLCFTSCRLQAGDLGRPLGIRPRDL